MGARVMSLPLLIVAASGRSAAFSALRAGFAPVVIDMFADADLAAVATVYRCDPSDFARSALDRANALPPMPWLYCGGVENHPELIDRISARHTLVGIPTDRLRQVRDPIGLTERLRTRGVAVPRTVLPGDPITRIGRWLVKPTRSAGGIGLRHLRPGEPFEGGPFVVQEFHDGPTVGALYLGSDSACETVGVCEQFASKPGNPEPFLYRGGLGPVWLPASVMERIHRAGEVLRHEFGMRGLFGVDFVIDEGCSYLIEVNPRPTASVELLEHATGRPLLAEHVQAFGIGHVAERRARIGSVAKRILYAETPIEIPLGWDWGLSSHSTLELPAIADLPVPLTKIGIGEPVLTVMAAGDSVEDCVARLDEREADIARLVAGFRV
jgi:predicted ATP-grasp superfamily ATP-dependent carboligase